MFTCVCVDVMVHYGVFVPGCVSVCMCVSYDYDWKCNIKLFGGIMISSNDSMFCLIHVS